LNFFGLRILRGDVGWLKSSSDSAVAGSLLLGRRSFQSRSIAQLHWYLSSPTRQLVQSLAAAFSTGFRPAAREELRRHFSSDSLSQLEAVAALPGAILDLIAFPNEDRRNRQNASIAGMNGSDAASIEDARRLFGKESKSLHRRAKLARYTVNFQDQLAASLSSLGLPLSDFLSRGAEFLTRFWSHVPSLHVDCELTLYRDRQWSRPVGPNDFADLGHLVIGVPYCSSVLVERFWARAIAETGLAKEYGTSVCTDLDELGPIIGA
jgi:hypothetical protein